MSLNAENVRVALGGSIFSSPVGTSFPTDISDTVDSPWLELGYAAVDGLQLTSSSTKQSIYGWQSLLPLRMSETERVVRFDAVLLEFSPENLQVAFGGGDIDKQATEGTYTFPQPGDFLEYALLLEFIDGTNTTRIGFPRMMQDGDVTVPLTRTDAAKFPLSFVNLASESDVFVQSDAAAFLAAASS